MEIPNKECHKETAAEQCKNKWDTNSEPALHITYISKERALRGLQTCNLSLMLIIIIILSIAVQIKDLMLEGALDLHKGLSRREVSLLIE